MTAASPVIDAFRVETVMLDLQGATKQEVLEEMVGLAVTAKALPRARKQEVLDALLEREARGSTGFGRGVAAPHARIKGLRKPFGLLARKVDGMDYKAVDGEPVHAFVMFISPDTRADDHLATLRWISVIARDPDFLSFIRQAGTAEEMLEVLVERAP